MKRDKRSTLVHVGVSDCETDNGENARMHETNTYAKAMHTMTWYEMHDKDKMQNKDKTQPWRESHIASPEKGKSPSHKYGKLHPGHYNTPPLREDLVPRSRMAPEGKRKGKRSGKTKLLLWSMSETMNLERLSNLKERVQQRWTRLQTIR